MAHEARPPMGRRPRDRAVLGRHLAQRGVRDLDRVQDRRPVESEIGGAARSPEQRAERDRQRRARQRAGDPAADRVGRRHRERLRRDHLRQGRRRPLDVRALGRPRGVSPRSPRLPRSPRARERDGGRLPRRGVDGLGEGREDAVPYLPRSTRRAVRRGGGEMRRRAAPPPQAVALLPPRVEGRSDQDLADSDLRARYQIGKDSKEACTLLVGAEGDLPLGGACPDWVLPNADAAGYFRFALASADLAKLTAKGVASLSVREKTAYANSLRAAFNRRTPLPMKDILAAAAVLATDPHRSIALEPLGFVQQARDWLYEDEAPRQRRALRRQAVQGVFDKLRVERREGRRERAEGAPAVRHLRARLHRARHRRPRASEEARPRVPGLPKGRQDSCRRRRPRPHRHRGRRRRRRSGSAPLGGDEGSAREGRRPDPPRPPPPRPHRLAERGAGPVDPRARLRSDVAGHRGHLAGVESPRSRTRPGRTPRGSG